MCPYTKSRLEDMITLLKKFELLCVGVKKYNLAGQKATTSYNFQRPMCMRGPNWIPQMCRN